MSPRRDRVGAAPAARQVRRVLRRPGLHAFEAAYDPHSRLAEHGHAAPFFTYVLHGSYSERASRHERLCVRGAVIFHDHESHTNEVGPDGTASLNVELDPDMWCELTGKVGVADVAGRVLGGDIEWPAVRVWRALRQSDTVQTLGVEEAVVLLCDAAQGAASRGSFEPHQRLDRSIAYLEAHLMDAHRLADVALVAGVHPMHLARLFRRRFGCSMGEFVRRRRIAWACGELARGHDTITAIAQQAGFADHAHFTRTFARITGCTPSWYRAQLRGF
jgi:AraC family transcriptional regulator